MASQSLLTTPLTHQSVTYISSCKSIYPSRGVFSTSTKKGFKRYSTSVITAMSELAPPTVLVTGAAGRTGMFILFM